MGPITLQGDYLPRLEPLLINSCAEFLSCLPEFEVPILAPWRFFYQAMGKLDRCQPYADLFCTLRTFRTTSGCSKRLSSKAAASEEARRTLRYVELLSDARTPLADFFSILLTLRERGPLTRSEI